MNNGSIGTMLVVLSGVPLAGSAYLMFVEKWAFQPVMQSIWLLLFSLMIMLLGHHVAARGARTSQRQR